MTIFVVIPVTQSSVLTMSSRLTEKFPGNFIAVGANAWFVAGSGTAKEISDQLGVTPSDSAFTVVVASVNGYFGLAPAPIWEWIAAKMAVPAVR